MTPDPENHRHFIRDCWRAFGERLWHEPELAADLYRAITNNVWAHTDGTRFAATWRAAGDIVAGLRMDEESDYLDYYFFVDRQGEISAEIRVALARFGGSCVQP